ncbi:hypothetical protein HY641_05175 [Candidatus Woesearchaeota archaeon]|nr:hypothetical protein [Candidatus Woesearchaeota archaeon]
MEGNRYVAVFALFILLSMFVSAQSEEQVIINSKDWQDVYSGSLYASLGGLEFHYVVEETQALGMLDALNLQKRNALLIESREKPFLFGYKSNLESKGLAPTLLPSTDVYVTNLDLARKSGLRKFIIVDDSFGYNALSVTPLAIQDRAFVLFASKRNIDLVEEFLDDAGVEDLMLFGRLDREVKDRLASFDPKIVNTGDRFSDNIEAMRRFYQTARTQQVILTNGEFIEPGIMIGTSPVFFIGSNEVPTQVIDFLKSNPYVEVGIVIGNDLTPTAKKIRDAVGIKVLIKFAQGRSSQLLSLDYFPMPKYNLAVEIKSVKYNTLTKQLEVVYENLAPIPTYVKATSHDVFLGERHVAKVGDQEAFFVDARETRTMTYPVDLSEYFNQDAVLDSDVIYGENPNALDRVLLIKNKVVFIQVQDDSDVTIESVEYNKATGRFEVVVQNVGVGRAYVKPQLDGVIVAGDKQVVAGETIEVLPGEKGVSKIRVLLEGPDFEDNNKIKVRLFFGSREDALIKSLDRVVDLVVKQSIPTVWIAVAIILLLIFLIGRKKRQ